MNPLEFEEKIGITFTNKDLLKQAFIHRSFLNENPSETLPHNERLEYLGDAVLELVVSEFLFSELPDVHEGELTAIRAALVNTRSLAGIADELQMDSYLLLSKGEANSSGRARQYMLANTFESFVGALFLDQGIDAARAFIKKQLFPKLPNILENKTWQDAKSLFQEKAQEADGITPRYEVLAEEGPDHNKHFVVGVFLNEKKVAEGSGYSKQDAEQDTARNALEIRGWSS
jgi:ribonuclease-3